MFLISLSHFSPIQHNINQWRQLHTVFALNESKNNDVKNESFDMCYGCQNIDMECDR